MKVYTKIVFNMADMSVVEEESFDYQGDVALAKGDGTAKDQLKLQNQLTQQQLQRENSLQDFIKNNLSQYLTGNQGFSPEQLALMKSQFLNSNDAAFNNAGEGVRSALVSRGVGNGQLPVGGDFVRGIAGLEGAKASAQSQGLMGIDLSNLQQALNNKFNTASLLNGQGAMLANNVGTFNSGASNALNTYVQAANQGFGNAFTSAFGSSLGKGLGSLATFGLGSAAGGLGSMMNGVPTIAQGGGNIAPNMPLMLAGAPSVSPFGKL
jgi:hypothetical protein